VKPSPEEATMSAKSVCVLAGVLLAAGALLSCSGEADEPVSDPLAGTWQTSDVFITFDSGEYTVAQGSATDTPFEGGTYEVDGTTVTLTPAPPTADIGTTTTGLLACSVGQVGVYEMTVSDDGSEIKMKVVSDDCADRRNDWSANSLKKAVDVAAGPSVPASNAAVFDFATDDLCSWFTAEAMNQIVADAQQRAGTDYNFSPFTSGDCQAESGWSYVYAGGLYVGFILEPVESFFARAAGDPDIEVPDVKPAEFVGHGFLDDEVSYQMGLHSGGFGYEYLVGYLRVDGHQDETLYFNFAIDGSRSIGLDTMTNLSLAMVNEALQGMNWTKATE
jgi:hypothetical protein